MNKLLNIFLLFVLSMLFACGNNTNTHKKGMTQFGDDKQFQKMHEKPGEIPFQPKGEEKWLPTISGVDARIYYVQPKKITGKVLFVFHEWWGLNDYIKRECDRFSEKLENTTIIGVDLYDGLVATDPDQARELMNRVTRKRANEIIGVVTTFAGSTSKIATIGWCFGGGWSLEASTMITHQAAGCVMYYGMPPDSPVDLAPLQCNILGIFGNQDDWVTPEVRKKFEQNCKIAKKNLTVKTYDAKHAFANPSSPRYNQNAAQMANKEALKFLRNALKLPEN